MAFLPIPRWWSQPAPLQQLVNQLLVGPGDHRLARGGAARGVGPRAVVIE